MADTVQTIKQLVAAKADTAAALAKEIWNYAELSYEETRSAAALIGALKNEGFTIEEGIAGIPTAFTATYAVGSGKPVVGFLAEYDALAGLSQKAACPVQEPVTPGGAGHGCGHNLLGTGCYAAAVALKDYLEREKKDGTVIFFGCPAEEGAGSKQFIARAGYFDGVDFAYTWHPATINEVGSKGSVAIMGANFTFDGVAAHAGAAPHLGRSALDAVELMADPALLEQARQEHRKRIGKGYICPIPPDVRPGTIPHGPQSTHTSVFSIHLLQLQQPSHSNRQWAANQQLTQ